MILKTVACMAPEVLRGQEATRTDIWAVVLVLYDPPGAEALRWSPGARVHVHVVTGVGTFTLTARVLRCAVWALHPTDGATYRGALQFDSRCESFRQLTAQPGSGILDAAS
jgi:hypothetical protein